MQIAGCVVGHRLCPSLADTCRPSAQIALCSEICGRRHSLQLKSSMRTVAATQKWQPLGLGSPKCSCIALVHGVRYGRVAQGRDLGVKRQPYRVEEIKVPARQVLTRLIECFSLERARCKRDKALGRRVRGPFGELAPAADWQGWQGHRICHLLHTPGRRKQQERRLYGEGHHRTMDLGTDLNIHGAHGVKPVLDPVEEADLALRKFDSEQLLDAVVDLLHHRSLLHDDKRAFVLLDQQEHRQVHGGYVVLKDVIRDAKIRRAAAVCVNESVVPPPEPRAKSVVSIDEETRAPQDLGSVVSIASEHVSRQAPPHAVSTRASSLQHVEQGSAAIAQLECEHGACIVLRAGLVDEGSPQARPCARQVQAGLLYRLAGESGVVDAEPERKHVR